MDVQELFAARSVPYQMLDMKRIVEEVELDPVARPVLLRTLRGYVVAIVPAMSRIDFGAAARALRVDRAAPATPAELQWVLQDEEASRMTPFGSAHGLLTMIDASLHGRDRIVFEGAGPHEGVGVKRQDFELSEHPIVARFTRPIHHAAHTWYPEDVLL